MNRLISLSIIAGCLVFFTASFAQNGFLSQKPPMNAKVKLILDQMVKAYKTVPKFEVEESMFFSQFDGLKVKTGRSASRLIFTAPNQFAWVLKDIPASALDPKGIPAKGNLSFNAYCDGKSFWLTDHLRDQYVQKTAPNRADMMKAFVEEGFLDDEPLIANLYFQSLFDPEFSGKMGENQVMPLEYLGQETVNGEVVDVIGQNKLPSGQGLKIKTCKIRMTFGAADHLLRLMSVNLEGSEDNNPIAFTMEYTAKVNLQPTIAPNTFSPAPKATRVKTLFRKKLL
ncbi:MAG: hypothetical protein WCO51_04745 [bacterium]|jgi:hypothetical protein